MSIPDVKTYHLDPKDKILRACDDYVTSNAWMLGATGFGAKSTWGGNPDQVLDQDDPNNEEWFGMYNQDETGFQCVLNSDGTVYGSEKIKRLPAVSGVWRQPYGWDDKSVKRRAAPVWDLFDYINSKFFNNAFCLDGFGEEVGGTRPYWSPKWGDPDIPGFGTMPERGDPPSIWTAYCTGKTGGVKFRHPQGGRPRQTKKMMRHSAGPHRDASVDTEEECEGYFSIVVVMNPFWKPSWEGATFYHETVDPKDAIEVHHKRGYGIGWQKVCTPQQPGNVYLVPSSAIHTAFDRYVPNRTDYQRRMMFRVRYKDLLNEDL